MGRADRRRRTALDEAYRYFQLLESGEENPDIFRLSKAVKTLSFALAVSDLTEFRLTKQLWKRLHQALFDSLITNFPGRMEIFDENRQALEVRQAVPENGLLVFYPDDCRRLDDSNEIELSKLYPRTHSIVSKVWLENGAFLKPEDFLRIDECNDGVCPLKPMVPGREVLSEESSKGRQQAQSKWWELYFQAYCTNNKQDQAIVVRQMNELEAIWGDLYN